MKQSQGIKVAEPVKCRAFIARREELAVLEHARKALAQSRGSVVLIAGEAGIGKTRLLNEFVNLTRGRRIRNIVSAECLQSGQQPLGPIRSLVRSLVSTIDLSGASRLVLRALAQVNPDDLPGEAVAMGTAFVLERDQLFSALVDFLRLVCAKRATILTIEDLHWGDDSTRQFLAYLAHRIEGMRLLVVATYRSEELDRDSPALQSLSKLFREPNARRLPLEPFLPEEIRELVAGVVEGRAPLPEAVLEDIEKRSEGNPFFAEELVSDYLEHKKGRGVPTRLPLSVRAITAQRLAGLLPAERQVLEYAAVLGQRFDPAILARVMKLDLEAIAPALRRARELNLLVDAERTRLSCRFRHALTRQTIYEVVPAFDARKLHAQILSTLEAEADAASHIEELAYHAWEAGDILNTVRYNEQAGDAALSLRALPEALICFERALEVVNDDDDRARLYERIGALGRLQGHYQSAVDAFEAAFAIRLNRQEFDKAAVLTASITGQRYNVGDQSALAFAEGFLKEHQSQIGREARDHLLVVCARVASAFCDFRSAERFLDSISGPTTLAPTTRYNYLIVQLMRHSFDGNVREWKRNASQVDQLVAQLTPESAAGIENALALTGTYIGANHEIERALKRAERIERDWGFRAQLLYGVATKGAYLYLRGRLAEARSCVEEVAKNQDVAPPRRIAAAIAAHLSVTLGDDSLWKSFQAILREARDTLNDPDCVFIVGAHAALLATTGALKEAQDNLRAAIDTYTYAPPEAIYVLLNAARFLHVDELSRVTELAEAASQNGGETARATNALVQATIASRTGKMAEAQAFGVAAARGFVSLGWPLLEANALELAGKGGIARTIYDRCGAIADLRRLSDLPERLKAGAFGLLSSRESEVATLIARGLRNTEIAARLNIGKKTVEKHLASVFRKLGLHSRSQVVAYMAATSREGGSS